MALIKIKKKQNVAVFIENQISGKIKPNSPIGGNQPPKKKVTVKEDISIILQYSPKKNKAKPIEEYSTLNPATSSASASGKSNGARLVSASIEIQKILATGSNGKKNHPL